MGKNHRTSRRLVEKGAISTNHRVAIQETVKMAESASSTIYEDNLMNFVSTQDEHGEEILEYAGENIDKLCNSVGHRDRRAKMVMIDRTLVRKTVPLWRFIGDSWFVNHGGFGMSEKIWDADKFIDLYPHKTVVVTGKDAVPYEGFGLYRGERASIAQSIMMAKGGRTWASALEDKDLIEMWACEVPRITIVSLGGCTLANEGFGDLDTKEDPMAKRYGVMVCNWIKSFLEKAEASRKTYDQQVRFQMEIKKHQWLIVKVPDWGNEDVAFRGNLDARSFRKLRRRANRGLEQLRPTLYKEHNAFVYGPSFEYRHQYRKDKWGNPTVHLTCRSQTLWMDQIIEAAARVICVECCHWTKGVRVVAEHEALYDNKLECPGKSKELKEFTDVALYKAISDTTKSRS